MMKTAIFGGGCFWCTEAVFQMLKGVVLVEPGYAGGTIVNPRYEEISRGNTGHAEVIRVTYDPTLISYEDLLTVFFGSHDPTTQDRQGYDVGEQYRSVIFYQDEDEKVMAERIIAELQPSLKDVNAQGSDMPIVTQVVLLQEFFPAEDYHKDFYKKNTGARYCELIIEPKLEKVRKRFAELVNPDA